MHYLDANKTAGDKASIPKSSVLSALMQYELYCQFCPIFFLLQFLSRMIFFSNDFFLTHQLHLCRGVRSPVTSVLGMTLNCIWWWGSITGDLGNVKYPLTAITPRSTFTSSCSTCLCLIYGSTICLILLQYLKTYILNEIASFRLQYLKPFNCVQIELFVLDRDTWNYFTV